MKPKDAISFEIKEQAENYTSYYLWNWNRDTYMKKISFYIKQRFIDEQLEGQLKELAELIGKSNDFTEKKSKLENERNQKD